MKTDSSSTGLQELLIPGIIRYMTTVIIGFLGIHTGFLVLFLFQRMGVMIVLEVLSLISYVLLLWKLHFRITRYDTDILAGFITFVLVEVDLYMIIAAVMMGEGCKFDNFVYGLLLITSFQFYVSHDLKKDIVLKLMIMVSYFGIRLWLHYMPPVYTSYAPWVQTFFSFANPIIVTGAIILFVLMVPVLIFDYEAQLARKASVDKLTGLLNRNYLDKIRFDLDEYNLAILDIDDFKRINDEYGHDNGDLVLKDLGRLLKGLENRNEAINVIRWGGEEFVIVYRVTGETKYQFLDILEQLRKNVAASQVVLGDGQAISYQITTGVAFSGEAGTYQDLLKVADTRLYWGKQHGKNMVVFHEK